MDGWMINLKSVLNIRCHPTFLSNAQTKDKFTGSAEEKSQRYIHSKIQSKRSCHTFKSGWHEYWKSQCDFLLKVKILKIEAQKLIE